jgi:hypothetical protein
MRADLGRHRPIGGEEAAGPALATPTLASGTPASTSEGRALLGLSPGA